MFGKDRFYKGLWNHKAAFLFRKVGHRRDTGPKLKLLALEGLKECHGCGLIQKAPHLKPGQVAECTRCGEQLDRERLTSPIMAPLAFCITSIALYLALLVSPLMTIDIYGRENTVSLLSGPKELINQGFSLISILVLSASVLMPAIVLTLMMLILYGMWHSHKAPHWIRHVFAWYERLRPWSMIEVYVIGLIVAYSKLVDLAVVILQPGAFLLGGLMVSMAAMDSAFNSKSFWKRFPLPQEDQILCKEDGDSSENVTSDALLLQSDNMVSCTCCHTVFLAEKTVLPEDDMGNCMRCGEILRRRKYKSIEASLCFLVAAFIFYIPANMLPIMTYVRVGQGQPNTILSGVKELWESGLYSLALLVLFASITIPVAKIGALAIMLYCETRKKAWHLNGLTKLYRFVCFIGRWSMIDVFMISILVAIVRFSFLAHVTADPGVVFFALVVVLTIFAADLYDPRGLWDAAGYNGALMKSRRKADNSHPYTKRKDMESESA
ncbi:paraquat-inducible protein A [Aristophania vespae]|uniref:paraquat-inducible protein A n=1 Tax=Aristophania vespae TaxID=2697033 RepID=UPI002351645A|nr:paraquat-inducible protein A [Aristophania vespae]UMM64232.1 Intermembrane transport protein PqiA [Aristophania vespae]